MSLPEAMHQILLAVLQGTGLLAIITVAAVSLRRSALSPLHQSLLIGILFGVTGLLLGVLSDRSDHGFVLDGRFMTTALAAAFGGLPAMTVAVGFTSVGRGWPTDHVGLVGFVGPVLTGIVALIWRHWVKPAVSNATVGLVVLGLMLVVPLVVLHSMTLQGLRAPQHHVWAIAATATVLLALTVGIFLEQARAMIRREQDLLEASLRDPLTRLHNRRSFDAELARVLACPGDHYLLYVDIDHFKHVNDRYGHGFGDEVLRAIAAAMTHCVRQSDTVARIGGEEFAIIVPDITRGGAQSLAERLLVAAPACDLRAGDQRVTVTVSIGAARRTVDHSAAGLMDEADAALYRAKRTGRRRAVFGEDSAGERSSGGVLAEKLG